MEIFKWEIFDAYVNEIVKILQIIEQFLAILKLWRDAKNI